MTGLHLRDGEPVPGSQLPWSSQQAAASPFTALREQQLELTQLLYPLLMHTALALVENGATGEMRGLISQHLPRFSQGPGQLARARAQVGCLRRGPDCLFAFPGPLPHAYLAGAGDGARLLVGRRGGGEGGRERLRSAARLGGRAASFLSAARRFQPQTPAPTSNPLCCNSLLPSPEQSRRSFRRCNR